MAMPGNGTSHLVDAVLAPFAVVSLTITVGGLVGNGFIVAATFDRGKQVGLSSKSNVLIVILAVCDLICNVGFIQVRFQTISLPKLHIARAWNALRAVHLHDIHSNARYDSSALLLLHYHILDGFLWRCHDDSRRGHRPAARADNVDQVRHSCTIASMTFSIDATLEVGSLCVGT